MVAFIGGIGGNELLMALAVALILFGPKRLPEFARKMAKISGQLRDANRQIKRELYSNLDPEEIMRDRPSAPPPPQPRPAAKNLEQGEEAPAEVDGEVPAPVEPSSDSVDGARVEDAAPTEESAPADEEPTTSREVLDSLDAGVDYDAPYRDAEAQAKAASSSDKDPDKKKADPEASGSAD